MVWIRFVCFFPLVGLGCIGIKQSILILIVFVGGKGILFFFLISFLEEGLLDTVVGLCFREFLWKTK